MKKLTFIFLISFSCIGFAEEDQTDVSNHEISLLDFDPSQSPPSIFSTPPPKFEELESKFLPKKKNVAVATLLSGIFPGLGHTYLEDYGTAGAISSTFGVAIAGGLAGALATNDPSAFIPAIATAQNTWSYGIYAAYRDARKRNQNAGFHYEMPVNSAGSLISAPFSWSVLKKPEVWGGYLGAMGLAIGLSYFAFSDLHISALSSNLSYAYPLVALPVGVGEESLFRGYLQPALSEYLTPWGGIVSSSILFGAAHIGNVAALPYEQQKNYYVFSIPFISALGTYFGWLTYKNNSLRESVAIHTWYDFTLFLASTLSTRAAIGKTHFCISIPF